MRPGLHLAAWGMVFSVEVGTGGWGRSNNLSSQSRMHHQLCYSRIKWSVRLASIQRFPVPKTGGLPDFPTHGLVEHARGFEPLFSTPVTVHRFVAGVGYACVFNSSIALIFSGGINQSRRCSFHTKPPAFPSRPYNQPFMKNRGTSA